jgi:hypothetical protein
VIRTLFGIFVMLHGLVHLWYVTLSRGLVEFRPEMGSTGQSWLFIPLLGDAATRWLATIVYALATFSFAAGGIGYSRSRCGGDHS